MHRRAWVCCGIGLALASAALACGRPAEETQEGTLTVAPPAADEVKLTVLCPPTQSNGNLRIVVSPPYKEVDPGQDVRWTRTKVGPGTHGPAFTIDVATDAERRDWPWELQDDRSAPLPWSGDTSIVGVAKAEADQVRTDRKYSIEVRCNNDTTIIDPRMKIR